MAFRMRFRILLPPDTSSGLHDNVDAKLVNWAARLHVLEDSGRQDPGRRDIDVWMKLAEGAAADVKTALWNLIGAEPNVQIWAHRCHNDADNAPCSFEEVYPKPARASD